jgi:hypothetical protein
VKGSELWVFKVPIIKFVWRDLTTENCSQDIHPLGRDSNQRYPVYKSGMLIIQL